MSGSPYAIPVEDLVASARIQLADQVAEQAEPRPVPPDWSAGLNPYADGMGGDVDGG